MNEKEILKEVWEQHLDNEDLTHEKEEHFCRSCLDLLLMERLLKN